jgi:hypothetical protein
LGIRAGAGNIWEFALAHAHAREIGIFDPEKILQAA